jgi:3-phosphoshikimate 1-carboxyvinyltransferase
MKCLTIKPRELKGRVFVPPSKSMAHRAIICSFLAEGVSEIDNVELSNDIIATCRAVESLGACIDILDCAAPGRKKLVITGNGTVNVKNNRINCMESGTTARFIIPVSRLTPEQVIIDGENRLKERPFNVFYDIFKEQGISFETHSENKIVNTGNLKDKFMSNNNILRTIPDGIKFPGSSGDIKHAKTSNGLNYPAFSDNIKLPVALKGRLKPGFFRIRGDVSSQFISGLLLALPLLEGDSIIKITTPAESIGYIDMTLHMQKLFGVNIDFNRNENMLTIPGWQKYTPCNYKVEGDWSQAAFWLAAGAMSGQVEVGGLSRESVQGDKAIEDIMKNMGINIYRKDGFLKIDKAKPRCIDIDVSQCPDLVPVLAVLSAIGEGRGRIYNAARLRLKESDRLKAVTVELKALGANIIEDEDSLIISGVKRLKGGRVYGWNDHRIVMAAAVAVAACERSVVIEGSDAVNKSYPAFWEHYKSLGGEFY